MDACPFHSEGEVNHDTVQVFRISFAAGAGRWPGARAYGRAGDGADDQQREKADARRSKNGINLIHLINSSARPATCCEASHAFQA